MWMSIAALIVVFDQLTKCLEHMAVHHAVLQVLTGDLKTHGTLQLAGGHGFNVEMLGDT